mmetsp:Transcript_28505/g.39252  ORF Transcript_28505/g.39252 Transcript_28505/m.39252 type:complete len:190 (+) Transcript_28505:2-571(+)
MDITFIKSFLATGNKKDFLHAAIVLQGVITFAFVISSFVVAGTANAGFNCVLTGFLNAAFTAGAYYVVENSRAPIAVGFLIGSSAIMTVLNLMTAVFWGQLSKCEAVSWYIAQYSCNHKTAYGAVCTFAVLLFLVQLIFTAALTFWRGEIINETGLYDDISSSSSHPASQPYETVHSTGKYPTPQSADL